MTSKRSWFARLMLAFAVVVGSSSLVPAAPVKPEAPDVDVVLCLDVSGSMNGLIDSAKARLWDIVNDLGKVKPTPNLRVALYSYGHTTYPADKGWVRKEIDLTTDLDAVYQKLTALTINGGTELVARVTRDALEEQKWSPNKKALRLIFVCGNEPADQDKQVTLKSVADRALKQDVIINTIYCGLDNHPEAQGWKDFAKMCEGRFVSINQNQGTVAVATPYDKELATLSSQLNTTYVAYGRLGKEKAENQQRQDEAVKKLGSGAAAARGVTKGGALYRNSEWDLVDRCKEDAKFDVTKMPVEQLPEVMRKMKPEERVKYIKDKQAEREKLQKEIAALNAKRAEYIRTEAKKQATQADKALDEAVRGTVRDQAAKKGIKIPD